jgi:hypothetical protein
MYPVSNSGRRLGGKDDEVSVIRSEQAKKIDAERLISFSDKEAKRKRRLAFR